MLTGQTVHLQIGFQRRSCYPALGTSETLPQVEQARRLVALFEEALETAAQCGGLAQVRSAFVQPDEEYGGAIRRLGDLLEGQANACSTHTLPDFPSRAPRCSSLPALP